MFKSVCTFSMDSLAKDMDVNVKEQDGMTKSIDLTLKENTACSNSLINQEYNNSDRITKHTNSDSNKNNGVSRVNDENVHPVGTNDQL